LSLASGGVFPFHLGNLVGLHESGLAVADDELFGINLQVLMCHLGKEIIWII